MVTSAVSSIVNYNVSGCLEIQGRGEAYTPYNFYRGPGPRGARPPLKKRGKKMEKKKKGKKKKKVIQNI